MRPNINVLENGVAITREMNEEEYAEYMKMLEMAESEDDANV